MRALGVALAFGCVGALTASAARAEPISVSVNSASSGFHADDTTFTTGPGRTIDLGTITLNGGASGFISIDGLQRNRDYTLTFDVIDPSRSLWTELTAEVLDPLSDGLNARDPAIAMQPSYVPAGFSTSTTHDGLSFAQSHGLERSATFAGGGSATLFADEDTNAHETCCSFQVSRTALRTSPLGCVITGADGISCCGSASTVGICPRTPNRRPSYCWEPGCSA